MQAQHLSEVYPNMISITQVRKDIDSLLTLLDKHPEVKVLRGQTILFTAKKSSMPAGFDKEKMKQAVEHMKQMAKKYKLKKGQMSGSEWIIRERDKMRKKSYYD